MKIHEKSKKERYDTLIHPWARHWSRGFINNTTAVFLNVEKVYSGLLHKLVELNTPTLLIKISQSFLENRTFKVNTANTFSSVKPILSGILQDFCLFPILLLVYNNDILISSVTNLVLIVDDTMFYPHKKYPTWTINKLQKKN